MESDSDSNTPTPPPLPFDMNIEELSLLSSPYFQTPPPSNPIDPNLLEKLALTTDALGEIVPKEDSKTHDVIPEETESDLEEDLPDEHNQRVPIVGFSSEASEDIIYDFNKENMLFQQHQKPVLKARVPKTCPECYQYLIEHQDYPLDDYEELQVSVRSPSGNKQKVVQQLQDLQKDIFEYEESSPASSGIPITTPRRSPYPKRPMTFNTERDFDAGIFDLPQSTVKCTKNHNPTSSCSFQKPNIYFVSTPQGFPPSLTSRLLAEKPLKLPDFQNKPLLRCPVLDLRKTYDLNLSSKKKSGKKYRSERPATPTASFKDKEVKNLMPVSKSVLSQYFLHESISKIEQETTTEANSDISVTSQPKMGSKKCNQKPSFDDILQNILNKFKAQVPDKTNTKNSSAVELSSLISSFNKSDDNLGETSSFSSFSSISEQTVIKKPSHFDQTQTSNSAVVTKLTNVVSKNLCVGSSELNQIQSSDQLQVMQNSQVYNSTIVTKVQMNDQTTTSISMLTCKISDEKNYVDKEESKSEPNLTRCYSNDTINNYETPVSSFTGKVKQTNLEKSEHCERDNNNESFTTQVPSKAENKLNTVNTHNTPNRLQKLIFLKDKVNSKSNYESTSYSSSSPSNSSVGSRYNHITSYKHLMSTSKTKTKRLWSPTRGERLDKENQLIKQKLQHSAIPRLIRSDNRSYERNSILRPVTPCNALSNYNSTVQNNLKLTNSTHRLSQYNSSVISITTPVLNEYNPASLWKNPPNFSHAYFINRAATVNSSTSTLSLEELNKQRNINLTATYQNKSSSTTKHSRSVQQQVCFSSKGSKTPKSIKTDEDKVSPLGSKHPRNGKEKKTARKNAAEKPIERPSSSKNASKYYIVSTTPRKTSLLGRAMNFKEYEQYDI